jgi:hypothetical protein
MEVIAKSKIIWVTPNIELHVCLLTEEADVRVCSAVVDCNGSSQQAAMSSCALCSTTARYELKQNNIYKKVFFGVETPNHRGAQARHY